MKYADEDPKMFSIIDNFKWILYKLDLNDNGIKANHIQQMLEYLRVGLITEETVKRMLSK